MGKASRLTSKVSSGPQLYYATAVPAGTVPALKARTVFDPTDYMVGPSRMIMADLVKHMVERGHFHKAPSGSKPGDTVEL